MARRGRTRSTTLEVRITFEPSRVSPACVAQAYERVVPITRRTPPRHSRHGRMSTHSRRNL